MARRVGRAGRASSPSGRGGDRGWLRQGVVLSVVGGVVALVLTYFFAPIQRQREDDATNPEVRGEPPFHVEVREAFTESDDGRFWVFPERLAADSFNILLKPLPDDPSMSTRERIDKHDADITAALRGLGGIRGGRNCGEKCTSVSRYHLTLTGNRKQPVHIESIYAEVISTADAPDGTLLAVPPEGGGPADTIYIDLDSQRRDAVEVDGRNNPTNRVFADTQNRFAAEGEPLDFVIIAGTERPLLYEWRLAVEVSQDGKKETMTIPAEGEQPFRTVGWLAVEQYTVRYGRDLATNEIVELEAGQWPPK